MNYFQTFSQEDRDAATPIDSDRSLGANGSNPSAWERLEVYEPNQKRLRRNRIVAGQPLEAGASAFDLLRTKLLRLMSKNGWTKLAITSPTPGCGKSLVSLNLAVTLSRSRKHKTVLLDLDRRRPSIHKLLGLSKPLPFDRFLDGECAADQAFLRWGESLAIGATDVTSGAAGGALEGKAIEEALETVDTSFSPDITVFDLPPVFGTSDVHGFLPLIDCVLIVAAAGMTKMAEVDACERELAEQTNVVGITLNKCRFMPLGGGY